MRAAHVKAACVLLVVGLAAGCQTFQKKPPEAAVDEYARAQSRIAAGDDAGAASLLERYVSANPESDYRTDAWLLLGDCRLRLKDYAGAQGAYQEAQTDARTTAIDAKARAGLGTALMHQKRWDQAARAYESALSVGAKHIPAATVMMYMAKAYIRSGNWLMGRDRLKKLVRKYPRSLEVPAAYAILAEPADTFSVQVGAFSTREGADKMLEKLKTSKVHEGRIVHQPWASAPFAVRVGSYVTYGAAVGQSQKLKSIEPNNFVVP